MGKSSLLKSESHYDSETLARLQSLPLEQKVLLSHRRIKQFYDAMGGKVYVAYSGGKDSTVLLHMVRSLYPETPAVFADTGLEYPEIVSFVKSTTNVEIIKPDRSFSRVLKETGYPVPSKENAQYIREARTTKSEKLLDIRMNGKPNCDGSRVTGRISHKWQFLVSAPFSVSEKCCDIMKKRPFYKYQKKTGLYPYLGLMAANSRLRYQSIIESGCNIVDGKRPRSRPLSVWKDEDVWEYIRTRKIEYCSIYDMGYTRTGCMFCMFGLFMEDESNTRFHKMAETHPKQYDYCMNKLGLGDVIRYCRAHLEGGNDRQLSLGLEKRKGWQR